MIAEEGQIIQSRIMRQSVGSRMNHESERLQQVEQDLVERGDAVIKKASV